MELAGLAKYPFLQEASAFIRAEHVTLEELLSEPAYARARAIGRARVVEALEKGTDTKRVAIAPADQHAPCRCRRSTLHRSTGYQLGNFAGLKGSPRTKPVISDQQSVLELHDGRGSPVHLNDLRAAVRNDNPRSKLIERLQRDSRPPFSAVHFRGRRPDTTPRAKSLPP